MTTKKQQMIHAIETIRDCAIDDLLPVDDNKSGQAIALDVYQMNDMARLFTDLDDAWVDEIVDAIVQARTE